MKSIGLVKYKKCIKGKEKHTMILKTKQTLARNFKIHNILLGQIEFMNF